MHCLKVKVLPLRVLSHGSEILQMFYSGKSIPNSVNFGVDLLLLQLLGLNMLMLKNNKNGSRKSALYPTYVIAPLW